MVGERHICLISQLSGFLFSRTFGLGANIMPPSLESPVINRNKIDLIRSILSHHSTSLKFSCVVRQLEKLEIFASMLDVFIEVIQDG